MEQRLREMMQEKLGGMSPEEVAPGFDKAGTWEELESRIGPEKAKTIPIGKAWLYAAAALLIGLILGGASLKYLTQEGPKEQDRLTHSALPPAEKEEKMASGAISSPERPAEIVKNTLPEPGTNSKRKADVTVRRFPPAPSHDAETYETATGILLTGEAPRLPDGIPGDPELPKKQAVLPAPRALHLLDVESEDRTVLLENGMPSRGRSFSLYLSPKRLPDGGDQAAPPTVIRSILR